MCVLKFQISYTDNNLLFQVVLKIWMLQAYDAFCAFKLAI